MMFVTESSDGDHSFTMSPTTTAEVKCPCCNNPWSAATGDFFAKLCQECDAKPQEGHGLSRSNMDFSVSPAHNFYEYANGGWMKENPIPAGYPSWNTFLSLHVKSQENLRDLLQGLESKDGKTPDEMKVAAFYAAAMDEDAIEAAGTAPMKPLLELIDITVEAYQVKDMAAYAKHLGTLTSKYGISPFFSIGASPDNTNSDHCLCQVAQGGLGLPDRDYYFDEDKEDKRVAYKIHVANMLALLNGTDDEDMADAAESIYTDIEIKLAEKHMTKTENRDPEATYNKMSLDDLTNKCCGGLFDFSAYFAGSTGLDDLGDLNVRHTAALERTVEIATTVDAQVLRNYLRWTAVRSFAQYLCKPFVDENFNFYERTLMGTQEIKPRWKRAMAFTESALGEALGQMYCASYFDEECKERALTIVENVREALEERLKEVDWIKSDETRENAMKKMKRFKVKIGYPDKWIDYTPLDISGDFLDMVFNSRAFEHSREVKEMNQPTNRDKWFMTPQTVNAYYHPSLNEIVFPAAILQHPFFNRDADDAVNYGAMGAVVGHEMTHGFDDKGRKFNSDGNMIDWWTDEDATEYMKRVEVMVNQANDFKVHDQAVQGKLTCGENIADSGGILLAYRALKNVEGFESMPVIDGFTPTQRFFLSWAQAWRQNITKERSLQLLTLDPHGPNEMRCNLPLSNIAEFHGAFDIPEGSPMFKPVDVRVDIW
jgi:putative endopeptidase